MFYGDLDHLTYWRGHSLPIVLVLFDPEVGEAYWQHVSERNIQQTREGWSVRVPKSNIIHRDFLPIWERICSPESQEKFLRRKQVYREMADVYNHERDRRQMLFLQAIDYTSFGLQASIPTLDESMLALLLLKSINCGIRLMIGTEQTDRIWRILREADLGKMEVKIYPFLHSKVIIFDSMLVMIASGSISPIPDRVNLECYDFRMEEAGSDEALIQFHAMWNHHSIVTLG